MALIETTPGELVLDRSASRVRPVEAASRRLPATDGDALGRRATWRSSAAEEPRQREHRGDRRGRADERCEAHG